MPATVSVDVRSEPRAPEASPPPRRRARKREAPRRWVREVQGIASMTAGVFLLVALVVFDPAVAPAEQPSMVGPVGIWLAWASFRAFGYAAFLFPLAAGVWGASAFLRPLAARGWVPVAGLLLLLLAATGLFQQATDSFAATRVTRGGIVQAGGFTGWTTAAALHATIGNAGAWLLLLTAVPVGALLVTQTSYAAVTRLLSARLARLRKRRAALRLLPAAKAAAGLPGVAEAAMAAGEPLLPTIVEPARPKSTLMEKGLSWQETFDFGNGGAEAFQLPPVGLLQAPSATELKRTRVELQDNAETLRRKLADFEVDGRIVQVSPGPIITSYEFEPAAGVKVAQVVNLADDLALALKAASVRIVGPIPGRGTVAVEVPNDEWATVYLREIFVSAEFAESKGKLPLALGKDVNGMPVVADLTAMPHLLVAGATGSGKSVGLNSMICSILYKATPADVRFLMVDPKRLELSVYEGIPHLLSPVVTDAKEAAARLRWIVGKMDERYRALQLKQVRNIEG